jgi:hypothetical protein
VRILFLVLLLILNVYAEAKASGPARSQSRSKKENPTVVAPKSMSKSAAKSKKTARASTRKSSPKSATPQNTTPSSYEYESPTTESFDSVKQEPAPATVSSANMGTASAAPPTNNVVVIRDTVVDTVYVVQPEPEMPSQKKGYNIPLPRQSAFLGEGFSVGIGAGLFNASKDCDCLGIWQGQLEYHYKEYLTGGFDVRFFGGTLDRDVMLMYQRYRLNVRAHAGFSWIDFYASVLFGLETTDLSEFRKELREGVHKDDTHEAVSDSTESSDGAETLEDEKSCEKMFSLDGFTIGFEAGMGVIVGPYLGFVGSATYEFNFSWAQLVSFSPGIAFNLHEVWPWANKNLKSTWISFEMVFQRYFNRNVNEWAVAGFLGLQFGI